jgi:hypothetical protein
MFDTTSRISYKNTPMHFRDIRRVCDDIPVVLVGTKVRIGTAGTLAVAMRSLVFFPQLTTMAHRKKLTAVLILMPLFRPHPALRRWTAVTAR